MVDLMSTIATLSLLFVTGAFAQLYQLNIRDNGKLCTQWILPVNGQYSISYSAQPECISNIAAEQTSSAVRLCCQGIQLTTSSTTFPKECGKQKYQPLRTRIISGSIANPNSWPWQILLRGASNMCGGALIDDRHVLTAAHCITTPVQVKDYKVYVGAHDINKMYMEQQMNVSNIWVHEEYSPSTIANDLAIIRLSSRIQISDTVNVICLPGAEANVVNDTVWISGWGKTATNGTSSSVLKQTAMQTKGNACLTYGSDKFSLEKQLCASNHLVGYTCQGDSGGPLMYEYQGQWYLNGVVSYGASDCGVSQGLPSVYARVKYYLPWIRSKMVLP